MAPPPPAVVSAALPKPHSNGSSPPCKRKLSLEPTPSPDAKQPNVKKAASWDALRRVALFEMTSPQSSSTDKSGKAESTKKPAVSAASVSTQEAHASDDSDGSASNKNRAHDKVATTTTITTTTTTIKDDPDTKKQAAATPSTPTTKKKPTSSNSSSPNRRHRGPCKKEIEKCQNRPRFMKALNTWYKRYNELVDFSKKHGNCLVPQKYKECKELGIWVNKMREEKKRYDEGQRSALDRYKIKALEDIGFQWAKKKGDELWEKRFKELIEYRNKYGRDPGTKVSGIGRWVSTQRCHYKQNALSQERIERLEAAGFRFSGKDEDDNFVAPYVPDSGEGNGDTFATRQFVGKPTKAEEDSEKSDNGHGYFEEEKKSMEAHDTMSRVLARFAADRKMQAVRAAAAAGEPPRYPDAEETGYVWNDRDGMDAEQSQEEDCTDIAQRAENVGDASSDESESEEETIII